MMLLSGLQYIYNPFNVVVASLLFVSHVNQVVFTPSGEVEAAPGVCLVFCEAGLLF